MIAAVVAVAALMALGGVPSGVVGPVSSAVSSPAVPRSTASAGPSPSAVNGLENSTWRLVNTTGGPSARAGFGTAYDPTIGAVVIFGGCTSGHYFNLSCNVTNETWAFSHGNWTQLHPPVSPSARVEPAMTYDAATGDILLFGGGSGWPNYLTYNDTWEFNGSTWTQVVSSPVPETGGDGVAMAYDSALGSVVLYDSGEVYHGGPFLNDTWTFSNGTWTRVLRDSGPSPRGGEMLTYDAALGEIVLFGGNDCSNQTGMCPNLGDTWTYANGTWTNRTGTGPTARNVGAFAYDPLMNASLLFSGHTVDDYYDDEWDYSSAGWTELTPPVGPTPSEGAGLTYDAADQAMVLFGGYENQGGPFGGNEIFYNQTWELAGALAPMPQYWSQVTTNTGPTPRAGFGIAYDPTISAVVVFGGCTSGHYFNISCNVTNETWTYSRGNWTQLHLAVSPSARVQPAMTYDAATGDVLLFGGASGWPNYLTYNDTWQFNGTAWSPVNSTVVPETGGYGVVMAYDSAIQKVVLFDSGEVYHGGPFLNDTWTFSNGQWTRVLRDSGPSPRAAMMYDYDPVLGEVVLFGGNDCSNLTGVCPNLGDTWTYSNGSWTNRSSTAGVAPLPRNAGAFGFDPELNASLLFAGHHTEAYYDDVWTYSGSGWTEVSTAVGPPPSEGGGLVYDAADHQMLLFGGYLNVGGPFGGTEIYYNGLWSFGSTPVPAAPSHLTLEASRTSVTVGNVTLIVASVDSGTPLKFVYSGLPTGCGSMNASVLTCIPSGSGNFLVQLTVTNHAGQSASASLALTVTVPSTTPKGPSPPPSPGGPGWSDEINYLVWGAIVGGLVAAVAAVAELRLRARYRREGEEYAAAMLTSGPPGEEPPKP